MTSRRGFLGFLGGAAAFALDPERALWVPGAKTISVPALPSIPVSYRLLLNPAVGGLVSEHWSVVDQLKSAMYFSETFYINQRNAFPLPLSPRLPRAERHSLARRLGVDPGQLVLK